MAEVGDTSSPESDEYSSTASHDSEKVSVRTSRERAVPPARETEYGDDIFGLSVPSYRSQGGQNIERSASEKEDEFAIVRLSSFYAKSTEALDRSRPERHSSSSTSAEVNFEGQESDGGAEDAVDGIYFPHRSTWFAEGRIFEDDNVALDLDDPEFLRNYLMSRAEDRDFVEFLLLENLPAEASATYPQGELKDTECLVCDVTRTLNLRPCCAFPVCNACLEAYFRMRVSEAQVQIPCPNPGCPQKVDRDEILARLDVDMKIKYNQFLVDANREPHRKTCPRCSQVTTIDPSLTDEPTAKKYGVQVMCAECSLLWCFSCQAPWHESMRCKDYRRGDKLVKAWARERPQGHVNAQKCPKKKKVPTATLR